MDLRTLAFLSLLTWLNMLSADKGKHKFHGNFWPRLAPGELLKELDLMAIDGELQNRRYFKPLTATEAEITTVVPFKKRQPPKRKSRKTKKPKATTPTRRIASSEADDSAASQSASVEQTDYERTYEQFVKRYFNDAANHYLSGNDDYADDGAKSANASQDVSNLSGSIESDIVAPLDAQPFDTAMKLTKAAKRNCRKVHKKGEVCWICKNPRTNEHSETCSYEHASEPETYAYETQSKFKTSRDSEFDGDDDDNVGAEDDDSSEGGAESKLRAQVVGPLALLNETLSNNETSSNNSSCIKRSASGGKVCYYCRNTLGKLQVNCLEPNPIELEQSVKTKPLNENSHKQRRIFKRTLSYVFEKGHDSNGTLNLPNDLVQNSKEHEN